MAESGTPVVTGCTTLPSVMDHQARIVFYLGIFGISLPLTSLQKDVLLEETRGRNPPSSQYHIADQLCLVELSHDASIGKIKLKKNNTELIQLRTKVADE